MTQRIPRCIVYYVALTRICQHECGTTPTHDNFWKITQKITMKWQEVLCVIWQLHNRSANTSLIAQYLLSGMANKNLYLIWSISAIYNLLDE